MDAAELNEFQAGFPVPAACRQLTIHRENVSMLLCKFRN